MECHFAKESFGDKSHDKSSSQSDKLLIPVWLVSGTGPGTALHKSTSRNSLQMHHSLLNDTGQEQTCDTGHMSLPEKHVWRKDLRTI